MAKLGEGDARWIVKDREDGRNVGNWHWSETNCLPWTKENLSSLLVNFDILNPSENSVKSLQNWCKITKSLPLRGMHTRSIARDGFSPFMTSPLS